MVCLTFTTQQGNQIRQIGVFKPQPNNEDYQDDNNSSSRIDGNQPRYIDPKSRLNGNGIVPCH